MANAAAIDAAPSHAAGKMDKPDRDSMHKKVDAIDTDIKALLADAAKITSTMKAERENNEHSKAKDDLFTKISAANGKFDELKKQQETLRKAQQATRDASRASRDKLAATKKELGFHSAEEIDNEVWRLETEMERSVMSLQEEKKTMAKISELKKLKPRFNEVRRLEASVAAQAGAPAGAANIQEGLKAMDAQFETIKKERTALRAQLNTVMEKIAAERGNKPDLGAKRAKLNAEIRAKKEEIGTIRDSFKKQLAEFNVYMDEKRAADRERREAERAAVDKLWKSDQKRRRAEKARQQPHTAEMQALEQCLTYCRALAAKDEAASAVAKTPEQIETEAKAPAEAAPKGMTVVQKKQDDGPKGKRAKKTLHKKESKKPATKAIRLDTSTIQLFDALHMAAPMSIDELPAIIAQLEKQLAGFEAQVAAWRAKLARVEAGEEQLSCDEESEADEEEAKGEEATEEEAKEEEAKEEEAKEEEAKEDEAKQE